MSCNDTGFNVWTDVAIPLIISPILLIIKVIYDKIEDKKNQTIILKNKNRLEKVSQKLKHFYWPLYIRLLKDYDIWSHFTIFHENFYNSFENDTSDNNSEDFLKCTYNVANNSDSNNYTYKPCNIPVHINCNANESILCFKHRHILEDKNGNKTNFFSKKTNKMHNSDITFSGNFTGADAGDIAGLTDNSKFEKVTLSDNLFNSVKDILLNNHSEINDIIMNNISIGEPDSKLGKELVKFI